MIRSMLLKIVLVVFGMGFVVPAAAQDDPEQLILTMSDAVFDVLEEYRATYDEDPEPMQAELVQLLEPIVDFEAFSRGVMGKYYDQATPDQVEAFIGVFKDSLVDLYTDALAQSAIASMTAQETIQRGETGANVVILVTPKVASKYTIQFNMRSADAGDWKVRNIILEGVNVGLTFRNQFSSAMDTNGGDLDSVIQEWGAIVEGQA